MARDVNLTLIPSFLGRAHAQVHLQCITAGPHSTRAEVLIAVMGLHAGKVRMVSRSAVAILALVALAAGVYSQNDGSTTGQFINKFVPLTIEIVSTGVANLVVTPGTVVSHRSLSLTHHVFRLF